MTEPEKEEEMKYMVLVNRKFMIAVEHDGSNGGAEHQIIDNYNGIQGAQAFDKDEMHTDYFSDIVQSCETISLKELKALSDRYEQCYHELAVAKDRVSDINLDIECVQKILDDLVHERSLLWDDENKVQLQCTSIRQEMNIKED